eukprot:1329736-Amorphochlora_amoeboformis.AAC.1
MEAREACMRERKRERRAREKARRSKEREQEKESEILRSRYIYRNVLSVHILGGRDERRGEERREGTRKRKVENSSKRGRGI